MAESAPKTIQLRMEPVAKSAEQIVERVRTELPGHEGLASAAQGVARAAQEAQRISQQLRKPWGVHRLPALFLAAALLVFTLWIYWRFVHLQTLKIALPTRDANTLHDRVSQRGRVRITTRSTIGSRETLDLLDAGKVDLGFVQGGFDLPAKLPRLKTPDSETLLFLLREGVDDLSEVRVVMTSSEGQGSHTVAKTFFEIWRIAGQVRFEHTWRKMTADPRFSISDDIDAVFVIKDLGNENTYAGILRLHDAGFRMVSADIGARALSMDFLTPKEIPAGFLETRTPLPEKPIATYDVATYLVARETLTPRLFAEAVHLLDQNPNALSQRGFEPTLSQAKEVFEAIEAFLGILVYLGIAFLTLLGIEIWTYRKRFNELNTIISLISMHQSDKDVLHLTDPVQRAKSLLYLGLCSDLLGIIGVITGYYSQENPSLLYNRLTEIIYQRSSSLKLNIQLKILHADIYVDVPHD